MDFNSLAIGAPFYILRKTESKPQLIIGTVKNKTMPQPKYQAQAVPNVFSGANIPQVLSVTVSINNKDETFVELPTNIEIAERGTDTFSGSKEAMLQAVDAMIQASKKSIDMIDYHKSVLAEGEKMLETLNPRYAEEKKRDKSIVELKHAVEHISEYYDVCPRGEEAAYLQGEIARNMFAAAAFVVCPMCE